MDEINEVMSMDALALANSPEAIAKVVKHMRELRARHDAGLKPEKSEKESKAGALIAKLRESGAIKRPEKEERRA